MKYIYYLFFLAGGIILRLVGGELIAIRGVVPDLSLIAICSISLLEGRARGTVWGFSTGLMEDFIGSGLLGAGALSRSIVSFLAGSLLHFRSVQNAFTASLVVGILSVINNVILFLVCVPGSGHLFKGIFYKILFPSLYTTFFAILIFIVVPESIWEKIYKSESMPFS